MSWLSSTFWRDPTALVNPPLYQSPFYAIESLHVARAYTVVAELGIADLLGDGPRTIDQLAADSQANPQSLLRILRLLASFGVFAEDRQGRFCLTGRARMLRSDVPGSLRAWLILMGRKEMWQAYACTLEGVRSGTPPFELAHGMPFWNYVDEQGEFASTFFAALHDWTDAHNRQIVEAFDFSRFRSIIDVGGGMGVLLERILLRYPDVRGTLLDRADAIAMPSSGSARPPWPTAASSWPAVFSTACRAATTPTCSRT